MQTLVVIALFLNPRVQAAPINASSKDKQVNPAVEVDTYFPNQYVDGTKSSLNAKFQKELDELFNGLLEPEVKTGIVFAAKGGHCIHRSENGWNNALKPGQAQIKLNDFRKKYQGIDFWVETSQSQDWVGNQNSSVHQAFKDTHKKVSEMEEGKLKFN